MTLRNCVSSTTIRRFLAGSLIALSSLAVIATAQNPVPQINQPLVPDTVRPGGAGFTLTVNGTGFVSGTVVKWNGSARTTTFVRVSQLKAAILSSDIAKNGTASVTAVNPGPGGGASNPVYFPVALPVNLSFGTSTFSAGIGPGSVATADFNKDGKLDLVVPDPGSGTVGILLGNGDGTFQAPVTYQVGQAPSYQFFQVAVGDLNGDGNPDFVVSDFNDNYVSVFLGNGDGTFKTGVTYTVGTNPSSVAIADVNRDGKLDLIASNQNCPNSSCGAASVSVLLGNGDGTFQAPSEFTSGQTTNWVIAGDFNGDGKLDLAVADGDGGGASELQVLLGNGDGTFQAPVSYALNTNGASLATADFNGDGKLDLVIADNVGVASIFLGNGDGTFQPRVDYSSGCGFLCSFPWGSVSVGDLNQDGRIDFAVSNSASSSVSVFLGNGDGTFQPEIEVPIGGVEPNGVVAGDFTLKGRLDLAVANRTDNSVSILLQNGTVVLNPPILNFGAQVVGTSATKKVTLANLGTTALTIAGIAVSGINAADFPQINNCGASLGVGKQCTISVTFTASQFGLTEIASLMITDSAVGSPQSVPLSGVGATSGPNATLSTTSLTFAPQPINTTSPSQPITLSNYGTQSLDITGLSMSGPFKQTHTCGATLASGASCTINVTFTPRMRGNLNGTLSITDNAPGSPQTVSLSGTGTVVELNPVSLAFGTHPVHTSTTLSTTLTNVGITALSISGITVTGTNASVFSQANTCGTSVAGGASCTISVTFTPTVAGFDNADVSISDNGGASPQLVPLSGAGCVYNMYKHKCITTVSPRVQEALTRSRTAMVPSSIGSSKIGTRVLHLVDVQRDDPYLANGTKRELLVRFWYPADADSNCKPAEYTSAKVWSYFSELTRLPLPQVATNSCLEAPVAGGAHSVVVFTHGYTGTFTDYTFLFEDLASRGYVVASVDHTYEATAVEYPDGRLVKSMMGSHLDNTWHTDDQSLSFALSVRLDDLKFVHAELERLNDSTEGPFAGKLDLQKVAVAGHSLGGLTTWLAVQQNESFKAAILLDPYLDRTALESTEKPVMLMALGRGQRSESECQLWSHLLGPRVSVNLRGAEHLTSSDAVWLAKGAIKTGNMTPERSVAAIRDYVAAFLDTTLSKGEPNPLLTEPSSQYPNAEVTLQKQALCSEPGSRKPLGH